MQRQGRRIVREGLELRPNGTWAKADPRADWAAIVVGVERGKRVGGTVYVHDQLLRGELHRLVERIRRDNGLEPDAFRVVKLHEDRPRLVLLDYPEIGKVAFPALRASLVVELPGLDARERRYSQDNPPVLHRQELLLSPKHPRRAEMQRLTHTLEEQGLLDDLTCARGVASHVAGSRCRGSHWQPREVGEDRS